MNPQQSKARRQDRDWPQGGTGRQGPAVRLRRMTPGDLPAVIGLEQELFPEDAWSEEMFASELSGRLPGRCYLVAEQDGQIAGYAGLLAPPSASAGPSAAGGSPARSGGQADVLTMAVARPRWGQGIGSLLLGSLLAEASRRGCSEVFLEVRADNPRAQQLYARHGFTGVGVRRAYYQPSGVDAIVMRRPLSPGEFPGPGRHAAPDRPAC